MIIPIIVLDEMKFYFNLRKLNRKVSLIVENFKKSKKPAWIVRIVYLYLFDLSKVFLYFIIRFRKTNS
jgi:hypothetical protein